MKYFLFIALFMFNSCKELTPTEKAQRNIKEYFANVKGYKPLSYGNLDSFYISSWYYPEVSSLIKEERKITKGMFDENNHLTPYGEMMIIDAEYSAKRNSISDRIIKLVDSIPSKFYGYKMAHRYVDFNNKVFDTTVIFDINYKPVLRDTLVYR